MEKAYCKKSAETTVIKYSTVVQRCFILRMISSDWKWPEKLPLTMCTYLLCVPQLLLTSHCYLYHWCTVQEWKINKNSTPKVMSSDQLDWKDQKDWIVTAKFVVLHCVVANFKGILGSSVLSITLVDFLGNKFTWMSSKGLRLWFIIGGFWFVCFVSVFQGRFVACDPPFSGYNRLVCFKLYFVIFLIIVICKNIAMSASFPREKFHSPSQFPLAAILSFVFEGRAGNMFKC